MKVTKTKHQVSNFVVKEYNEVLQSCIHFHGIQIKSLKIFRKFCRNLENIEEIIGIHSVTISMEDIFVCPDIVFPDPFTMKPIEKLVYNLIKELERQSRE